MMKRDLRFSRRRLLKSIGAGAALLPMLHADRTDAACYVGGIKRLYILAWTNGMLSSINNWATAGNDPEQLVAGLDGLSGLAQPYMSDLLLLKGIDYKFIKDMPGSGERTGHACFPGMLTGAFYQLLSSGTSSDLAGGISVDQYIGNQLQTGGYKGLVSLNQGTFVVSTGHLSWKAAGQVVLPNPDPNSVFNLYFKGALPTHHAAHDDAGGHGPAAPAARRSTTRTPSSKSILDYVITDLNRFSNIVGSDDKQSIDAAPDLGPRDRDAAAEHGDDRPPPTAVDGGAPISTTTGDAAACNCPQHRGGAHADRSSPTSRPSPSCTWTWRWPRSPPISPASRHADLRSRRGQPGHELAGFASGGPLASDPNTGDANGFHAIAHENTMRKVTATPGSSRSSPTSIGQMKSITDGTGKSMLDSSVVVGMNSMRSGTHETTGVPVVMAGSCGGYFKTGRSLALPAGTPNNGLLGRALQRHGHPGHDLRRDELRRRADGPQGLNGQNIDESSRAAAFDLSSIAGLFSVRHRRRLRGPRRRLRRAVTGAGGSGSVGGPTSGAGGGSGATAAAAGGSSGATAAVPMRRDRAVRPRRSRSPPPGRRPPRAPARWS